MHMILCKFINFMPLQSKLFFFSFPSQNPTLNGNNKSRPLKAVSHLIRVVVRAERRKQAIDIPWTLSLHCELLRFSRSWAHCLGRLRVTCSSSSSILEWVISSLSWLKIGPELLLLMACSSSWENVQWPESGPRSAGSDHFPSDTVTTATTTTTRRLKVSL